MICFCYGMYIMGKRACMIEIDRLGEAVQQIENK